MTSSSMKFAHTKNISLKMFCQTKETLWMKDLLLKTVENILTKDAEESNCVYKWEGVKQSDDLCEISIITICVCVFVEWHSH